MSMGLWVLFWVQILTPQLKASVTSANSQALMLNCLVHKFYHKTHRWVEISDLEDIVNGNLGQKCWGGGRGKASSFSRAAEGNMDTKAHRKPCCQSEENQQKAGSPTVEGPGFSRTVLVLLWAPHFLTPYKEGSGRRSGAPVETWENGHKRALQMDSACSKIRHC